MESDESNDCCGCGKVLDGQEAMRVEKGTLKRPGRKRTGPGVFKAQEKWGFLCKRCFLIQVGDPDAIDVMAKAS